MKNVKRLAIILAAIYGIAAGSFVTSDGFAKTIRFYDPASQEWQTIKTDKRGDSSPIKRKLVDYDGPYKANTIVINTEERRLYHIFEDGKAMIYGVGVGRDGFQWSGKHRITRKAEWPGWTPPPAMRKRQPGLPAHMEGGPNNPLGARALYIGSTIYRIHGSNEPWTIGTAVSSGCIRMANEDVIFLYDQVEVGARVVVVR
jgi:lipoprotein-anchoring transpeptidase ErfK/SrfK